PMATPWVNVMRMYFRPERAIYFSPEYIYQQPPDSYRETSIQQPLTLLPPPQLTYWQFEK
ncbi:MAG: hypothetical protein KAS71_13990, partial [Bacteroidales bacterium]|nr:hypothetical protein [Bacteroidales bacterium]